MYSKTKQKIIKVNNTEQLFKAVNEANKYGNLIISIQDGKYVLNKMIWLTGSNVTFKSQSGKRSKVILMGKGGMTGKVSHIFNVVGKNFTARDITIGWVANHAIQIHGESNADNCKIINVRFVDTREQMLKVSTNKNLKAGGDNGLVIYCLFEYSAKVGPQYYIGGIDCHNGSNWIVRNNIFKNIKSPESRLAEHAIHFWSNSSNTLVEKNIIINCDRGIGFGLGKSGHIGGIIKNNMIYTTRDVGIGLENSKNTKVYNNTIYTERYNSSIEYRFRGSKGIKIYNNLTNKNITKRDSASAEVKNNYTKAKKSWFIDIKKGNLHLKNKYKEVVDKGINIKSEVKDDIDRQKRPMGLNFDIGADEVK
jgi:parallel beta-helix repeat protein